MTQASLANYSVLELIQAGFDTFKDGAREAGRYFCEAEDREPGSVKRYCQEHGGDCRDATRALTWFRAYAGAPKPEKPGTPKAEPRSPFERALKAALKLSNPEKERLATTLVTILEAA